MDYASTTTASYEALPWCSICKRSGHTAEQHKDSPEIYGKIKEEEQHHKE